MHTKEIKRQLPCHFTPDQLREKADALAQQIQDLMSLEDQKKQIATDFKNRIEVAQAQVKQLSHHIRQKYEFSDVACVAYMDNPEFGKKSIVRTDTGEHVGVEFMTPEDRQIVMQFESDATGQPLNDETPSRRGRRFQ